MHHEAIKPVTRSNGTKYPMEYFDSEICDGVTHEYISIHLLGWIFGFPKAGLIKSMNHLQIELFTCDGCLAVKREQLPKWIQFMQDTNWRARELGK